MSIENSSTKRRAVDQVCSPLLFFALVCSCWLSLLSSALPCFPLLSSALLYSPLLSFALLCSAFHSFDFVYSPLFLFALVCSPLLSFALVCLEISLNQFECKNTFDSETITMRCESISASRPHAVNANAWVHVIQNRSRCSANALVFLS